MTAREPCPSCDRDLSAPGVNGHECYTYAEHAARLVEASSLGTPSAKAARESVPDEVAQRIVVRAKELERTTARDDLARVLGAAEFEWMSHGEDDSDRIGLMADAVIREWLPTLRDSMLHDVANERSRAVPTSLAETLLFFDALDRALRGDA